MYSMSWYDVKEGTSGQNESFPSASPLPALSPLAFDILSFSSCRGVMFTYILCIVR
jgi:hypothetical protein